MVAQVYKFEKENGGEKSMKVGIKKPLHEKTCFWGLQPGKTQTCLLSNRD